MLHRKVIFVSLFATMLLAYPLACLVDSVCYNDADCPAEEVCISNACKAGTLCATKADCPEGQICHPGTGNCVPPECTKDEDCTNISFACKEGLCVSREPLACPTGMLSIANRFCIDQYEASRPDATSTTAGTLSTMATSRGGVRPWEVRSNLEALNACQAADKTLCTEQQWFEACRGPSGTTYGYGNIYEPTTCSGIDKYCYCDRAACINEDPCPFAGCFHSCGAAIILDATGSNAGCVNGYDVYDMNGGVWEHVLYGDERRIRGGAFNCSNSERFHRCDYIPTNWTPSARGFRCCAAGQPAGGDAGVADGGQ